MKWQLALMTGVATVTGAAGIVTLVRPALTRRVLRLPDAEAATYALRIAGMMLFAFGLVLAAFVAMAVTA